LTTLFLSHPSGLEHDTGAGHPERADRLRIIEQMVEHERFQNLHRALAPGADTPALLRVHPEEYVRAIEAASPKEGRVRIDGGDTVMSPGTWEALMHTIGGASAAVNEVMRGNATNAFVAMRPCGHHAERATPMGFCFFNTAAIAARHAQAVHGAERVAIIDFDVHHGNGTQARFADDPTLFYGSTHQFPLYPGTGAPSETGVGNIVNVPLRPLSGSNEFRLGMTRTILPALDAFRPEMVLISAGFDAHRNDPLAQLLLEEADYTWVTERLLEVARQHAGGRVVATLEGGYDLAALKASTAAHLRVLMSV
jgi:acetoin utilization deacetylase AcuC-like enzyme